MTTDIERLLAAAADDTDRPLHTDVDAILARGRRSVRRGRIAVATTAVLTTAAIIGGVAAWSNTVNDSADPAGDPKNQTITVDSKTGQVVDNESGRQAAAPPPVSPLSDAEVLQRCKQYDNEYVQANQERGSNTFDKAGPIDARWKVLVKSGDQSRLQALFLAPDQSIVSTCTMEGPQRPKTNGRYSTTESFGTPGKVPGGSEGETQAVSAKVRIPADGVARVLVNFVDEQAPRQALVGPDGFFTLGFPGWEQYRWPSPDATGRARRPEPTIQRVRAYDADGRRIYDWKYQPVELPQQPTVPADRKIELAAPITPEIVLTEDPATGKRLQPAPPVSPVSDDSIRTRCKKPDDAYLKGGALPGQDSRTYDAGKITPEWKVALKTGTGIDFTALLVSPGDNVVAWCHMYDKADHYDYSRGGVPATGKFGVGLAWGQVPDGVAQIVVDLPSGPVRALISNGFFIWGLTGGNSDVKNVRVRGFDAQGKQVYDANHDIDAS
ncbi:hypothetical protein ACIBL3_30930 [Kribbella sp. NPDC050124]|uniref:hypothetical protein n=1 Tax=Kribbella sp. NPDC050124 TaxID=3364114 RepID=UPI00379B9C63